MAGNPWLDQLSQILPPEQQPAGPFSLMDPNAPAMPMAAPVPMKPQIKPQHLVALQAYLPKAGVSGSPETDAFADQSKRALDDQKATLGSLNDYIDQIAAKPRGVNYSPLAAYVDSLTGSNLAPTAQAMAPMSQDEKDKMLFGLRNQLAQGQQKFSADQLKALKEQQQMQQWMAMHDERKRHNLVDEEIGAARGNSQNIRGQVALAKLKIGAGEAYEKNHIINTSKESNESLIRAESILNNLDKPVTAKDFNLASTDYINAVAKGGAATEGKIGRELPETFAQKYNEFQQKFGVNADLRASPAGRELLSLLQENIRTVKGDINGAINRQAKMIEDNYRQVGIPGVAETVDTKMNAIQKAYPMEAHTAAPKSADEEALAWARSNPKDPRALAILRANGGR